MNNPSKSLLNKWRAVRSIFPWLLVLAPGVFLFFLMREHMVNIPFLDDWMFMHQFAKEPNGFHWTFAKDDTFLTLHDFFRVQMEHRMAFVRAVIMVLHKLGPKDYTLWMWLSWVILSLTGLNVAMLLRRTTGRTFSTWWPLLALMTLTIFTPLQYRIVLWAMMFQVTLPAFFLSSTLLVFTGKLPLWAKWIVGVICASCATQTLASGLLVWLLPLPLIFFGGMIKDRRAQLIFTVSWLAVFGITLGLYFTNLVNEEDPAFTYGLKPGEKALGHDTSAFLKDPGRSIPYVMRFLGNHLCRGTSVGMMDASLWIGATLFITFLAATAYFFINFRRIELREKLLPWLLFGSYSIACGLLVAMGRLYATASGNNVLAARYIIHAVPLTLSLIALAWLIAKDWLEQRGETTDSPRIRTAGTISCTAFIIMQLVAWAHGVRMMEMWESSRLRGATSTMFFKQLSLNNEVPSNRTPASIADSLKLLKIPMLNNLRLDNFVTSEIILHDNSAKLTSLDVTTDAAGKQFISARGYASLPRRDRVADGVFLTYKDEHGDWQIFQVAQVSAMPLYLLQTIGRDTQFVHVGDGNVEKEGVTGFSEQCKWSAFPKPERVFEIAAWAFDYRKQSVFAMEGKFEIDTVNKKIRALKDASKSDKDDDKKSSGKGRQ